MPDNKQKAHSTRVKEWRKLSLEYVNKATQQLRMIGPQIRQCDVIELANMFGWCPIFYKNGVLHEVTASRFYIYADYPNLAIHVHEGGASLFDPDKMFDYVCLGDVGIKTLCHYLSLIESRRDGFIPTSARLKCIAEFTTWWRKMVADVVMELTTK